MDEKRWAEAPQTNALVAAESDATVVVDDDVDGGNDTQHQRGYGGGRCCLPFQRWALQHLLRKCHCSGVNLARMKIESAASIAVMSFRQP